MTLGWCCNRRARAEKPSRYCSGLNECTSRQARQWPARLPFTGEPSCYSGSAVALLYLVARMRDCSKPSQSRPDFIRITIRMYAQNVCQLFHSCTHLIPALGIVREPAVWDFIMSDCTVLYTVLSCAGGLLGGGPTLPRVHRLHPRYPAGGADCARRQVRRVLGWSIQGEGSHDSSQIQGCPPNIP